MNFLILILLSSISWAQVKTEGFIIQIFDRSMKVSSPEKKNSIFSVIIQNSSFSDQIGKFTLGNKTLKFVSIPYGKSEIIEIENKSQLPVVFVPVSPSFQEVPLNVGKKTYEIPSKR